MKMLQHDCHYPRKMLDSNLAMDRGKITYISQLPHGEHVILKALNEESPLSIPELADRFGVEDMLQAPKDNPFMVSLLYYFGVLTLGGNTPLGELIFKIPNLVIRKLYIERMQTMLFPDMNTDEALQAAKTFFSTGDFQPVCDFIEQRYFKVFDNRDYRWTNELTIKTVFLTLLFNDLWYIMDSKPALHRDYADLIMIVRPDMRQYQLLDILIEFKYIPLKDINLSGEQVRQLGVDEIRALSAIRQKLVASQTKLKGYRQVLENTYGEVLRLHTYTVVSLGFERLIWEENC